MVTVLTLGHGFSTFSWAHPERCLAGEPAFVKVLEQMAWTKWPWRLVGAAVGVMSLACPATASEVQAGALIPRLAPARATFIQQRASRVVPLGLTHLEKQELAAGAMVTRPMEWEPAEGVRFVGGVSYVVVDGPPELVLRALSDYANLKQVLPRTRRSDVVTRNGNETVVELEQGTSLVSATYSVVVARDGNRVRFWMDQTRPHGIKDTWGYFRAEPFDDRRSLVTVAALVDLGPGLARMLFESRVKKLVLTTPTRIRAHVEPLKLAKKQ